MLNQNSPEEIFIGLRNILSKQSIKLLYENTKGHSCFRSQCMIKVRFFSAHCLIGQNIFTDLQEKTSKIGRYLEWS